MNLPTVRITSNRFLAPIFAEWGKKVSSDPNWLPLTPEKLEARVAAYNDIWKPVEEKALSGICEALDLHFKENLIQVYVVSGQKGGMSNPLIISPGVPNERFLNLIIHELVHRLLTFNIENPDGGAIFGKMFPEIMDEKTVNHIMIHAALQYVYLDALKDPSILTRDTEFHKNNPGYHDAWEIVFKRGYKELLAEFKSYYAAYPRKS